jgi:hypothetical protein
MSFFFDFFFSCQKTENKRKKKSYFCALEDDFYGSFAAHDCDLGSGPRVVGVATQMLATHHIVRTSITEQPG